MKKIAAIRALLGSWVFFALSACGQQADNYDQLLKGLYRGTVKEISPAQLQQMMNQEKDFTLLDTREPAEYGVSHIPGAHPVGYDDFSMQSTEALNLSGTIVLYCSVGYRSERIGEQLMEKGYENVVHLRGGIFSWVNEGHAVSDSLDQTTDKVHGYSPNWGKWVEKGEVVYD